MSLPESEWTVKLTRTLWFNTYRAQIANGAGDAVATLRIIPALPLDRSKVPADAPAVQPYILALVEDAVFPSDQLVEFESRAADLLLSRLTQPDFAPAFCQFAYPSPPGA